MYTWGFQVKMNIFTWTKKVKMTKTFILIIHSGYLWGRQESALSLKSPSYLSDLAYTHLPLIFSPPKLYVPVPVPFLFWSLISLSLSPYLHLHLPDLWFVWITPSRMYIIYLSEPPASTTSLACYFLELSDFYPLLLITYATLQLFNLSFLLDLRSVTCCASSLSPSSPHKSFSRVQCVNIIILIIAIWWCQ